jgi:hypothetical protein
MRNQRPLDPTQRAILRFLLDLAERGGGYERRGVRGWVLSEDVAARTVLYVPERLPALARARLADREDVRAPGLNRPTWIYRINEAGAGRVREETTGAATPLPEPRDTGPDPAVAIPIGCRRALLTLRAWRDLPGTPPAVPGETGWALTRALMERAREQYGRGFFQEDLDWLVRGGLVERRDHATSLPQRPVYVYRAAAATRHVVPLEWHEPG